MLEKIQVYYVQTHQEDEKLLLKGKHWNKDL